MPLRIFASDITSPLPSPLQGEGSLLLIIVIADMRIDLRLIRNRKIVAI